MRKYMFSPHSDLVKRHHLAAYVDVGVRALSIFILSLVAFACGGQSETQSGQPGFDEESIDNVWHRAKLRGVAFRAIGQEPGWLLEITNGTEILLVTDYGQNRNSYPCIDPVAYQGERRTQYVLEGYGIIVEIRDSAVPT